MIETCFSDQYSANTPTTSMRKLRPVAKKCEQLKLARLISPTPVTAEQLKRLHAPDYIDSFISGKGESASSQGFPWTPEIRDGVLAINGGQIKAAQLAFEHRIAANIGQGFHHSVYSRGGGFCTFNGLALVAQENPTKKIFVLDCDEHCGDGTAEFAATHENLFNFSICGTDWSCARHNHSRSIIWNAPPDNFPTYQYALNKGFDMIRAWKPDLVIYQAGADCHINDPLGRTNLTTEQMFARDKSVFAFCKKWDIPIMFVLAGGYQKDIENNLVPLHVNTFRAADLIYTS